MNRMVATVRLYARALFQVTGVVYLLIFATAVGQSAIVPLLPAVQHHYHLHAAVLAWILTLPSLATLVSATPLGALGDRIGPRWVTVAAGVVIAASTVGQAVPSLVVLVVARLAFGVGYGALWTTGLAWLAETGPGGASKRMAGTVTASAAGSMVGPTLSGAVAGSVGFAAPFLLIGAVAMVITVLLVRARAQGATDVPATSAPAWNGEAVSPQPRAPGRHRWLKYSFDSSAMTALRLPAVVAGAATLALSGGIGALLQLLVPLQLHASGHSASEIGLVLSAGSLGYIVIGAGCLRAGPRLATMRVNAVLAAGLGAALLPALFGSGMWWVLPAVVLSSIPRAVIGTVAYSLATGRGSAGGPGRGVILGTLNTLWAVVTVAMPVVAGATSAVTGPRWAYAGTILVVAAIAMALWRRAIRPDLDAQGAPVTGAVPVTTTADSVDPAVRVTTAGDSVDPTSGQPDEVGDPWKVGQLVSAGGH